jgi:hypothetical protein
MAKIFRQVKNRNQLILTLKIKQNEDVLLEYRADLIKCFIQPQ